MLQVGTTGTDGRTDGWMDGQKLNYLTDLV
jgi:hypothetical protein